MKESAKDHLSEAEEALADFDRWRASINGGTTRTEEKLAGALRDLLSTMPGLADAWDEGHKTLWRRGPDGCQCGAWSSGECACGEYGNGELLSLKSNPYRNLEGSSSHEC